MLTINPCFVDSTPTSHRSGGSPSSTAKVQSIVHVNVRITTHIIGLLAFPEGCTVFIKINNEQYCQ